MIRVVNNLAREVINLARKANKLARKESGISQPSPSRGNHLIGTIIYLRQGPLPYRHSFLA